MADWREAAAKALADERLQPAPAPQDGDLPGFLVQGLDALGRLSAPGRTHKPDAWERIVADAGLLRDCRWASRAMALGWDALEVFGIDRRCDDPRFLGLAAWLYGKRVRLIDDRHALAREEMPDGEARMHVYNRARDFNDLHRAGRIVWLWEYGRR